jgi:hypothetical protein
MEFPDELLSAAMLGTAHAPNLGRVEGPLGDLLAQAETSPEGKLLLAAAGLRLQQRAGWQPPTARPARSTPCEPDSGPRCSPRALRHLVVMLNNYYQQALPEWLAELGRSGRRIPEEFLPLLLDAGRRLPELQPAILPLLGNRGLWLARESLASRSQWAWATLDKIETIWQEGKREERLALLKQLRWREPARARELLQGSWRTEAAQDREAFLRTFGTGLTLDDEPFLETVLDERVRGTGQVAADLLTRLPGSAYAGRMAQRLDQLLELVREKKGYRLLLRVGGLPRTADLERDRIVAYPAKGEQIGADEWLLAEVVTRVAPNALANRWGISFGELLAAGQASKLDFNIVQSWALACQRTADSVFALFLLRQALPQLTPAHVTALALLLPPAETEAIMLAALQPLKPELNHNHLVFPLLLAHRQPWSEELATRFLARLGRYLQRGNVRPAPEMRTALLHVALCFPPGRGDELLHVLAVETSAAKAWEDMVDDIRLLLAFRQEMRQAIYEESKP